MEENLDIPDESMRHIEALLSRHPPQMIQRMFAQALDSRRNSVASSFASSFTSSTGSSFRSRLSVASTFSTSTGFSTTSTGSSEMAPSIASSSSSRSRVRRPEPRSYPSGLDPTRPVPASHTPASDISSPLEPKQEPGFTPTDESMSIASPGVFANGNGQSQTGESYMFCTYCAELKTLKTFKAKSDWKKHEMRMHETGEDWPCIVIGCNRIFDRQKDFVKHHQRYHSGRPLPSLTDIGIQLLPRRVFGCGFDKCKEVSIGWDERCDHVAKHMKNGSSFETWKYSNVIRNLIRQEALHDTWKDLVACLDERLRESRSQISWCPDNTRTLRQKLQCCDLRPSREEVLITALSLRSDVNLDSSYQEHPPGFITPSRDSVPNVTREQRMHILIGNPNASLSQTRLAAINAALLQACNAMPNVPDFDCGASPFIEDPPTVDTNGRRISYMDIDPGEFLDMAQPEIPSIHHDLEPHPVIEGEQSHNPDFIDPGKPSNPLGWCYPNYFDAAPTFEESPYYDRPSFGQMFSKPLHKIGSKLSSRHQTPHPHSRASSQADPQDLGSDFSIPTSHPPHPPHPPMQAMTMRHPNPPPHQHPNHHQFRNPDHPHDQLHLFTPHG
ncbi:hypothetical protein K505DRAFT_421152 [Melanomma pulvis-pyrius CBS 109.77]|uniref:C2H2-type domain-containing protein n=1 Tax=Melanomma pulvis-pyrius CBS 109.77 TaxID=1314802 RepID=A0A6A6WWU2_9PLEO|nr:hypothetical protein K505DRAFT_421152 [Melanomma pulvis-pyrius CBS 109.77]